MDITRSEKTDSTRNINNRQTIIIVLNNGADKVAGTVVGRG